MTAAGRKQAPNNQAPVAGVTFIPSWRELRAERCGSRYSIAMPFWASSFFAFSFLARRVSPMPRSTLGALVN
jgi:hypothetical protein